MPEHHQIQSSLFLWQGASLFIGSITDSGEHNHLAVQICFSLNQPFKIQIDSDWIESHFVIIPAGIKHRFDSNNTDHIIALIDHENESCKNLNRQSTLLNQKPKYQQPALPTDLNSAKLFLQWLISPITVQNDTETNTENEITIDPRISQTTSFLKAQSTINTSALELAKLVFLSESRFLHLFTENIGLPLRRYILWQRLLHTINDISRGSDLTHAAHCGGFSDSAHFSRTFKECFGYAPSTILKNSRNIQVIT